MTGSRETGSRKGSSETGSSEQGEKPAGLDGTSWVLSGWAEPSAPGAFAITAAFADGGVTGGSGVNRYGGAVAASADGGLSVGVLWSTMMAGPEPAMRAEAAYHRQLAQAVRYRFDADRLVLLDADGVGILTFEPARDR